VISPYAPIGLKKHSSSLRAIAPPLRVICVKKIA
jgi:hypothetical protein